MEPYNSATAAASTSTFHELDEENLLPTKKRLDIGENAAEIIRNVYTFLGNLKKYPDVWDLWEKHGAQEMTAAACGISLRTVQKITCKNVANTLLSPRKGYSRQRTVTNLDNFDEKIVRRTILEFYDNGEFPTLKNILYKLKEKINFIGSKTSLWRIIKKMGFKYKKNKDGRKFLLERNDVVAKRNKFLRQINRVRAPQDGRSIYYLDETWVNINHSKQIMWISDKDEGGLNVPPGRGGRLIICHVGSGSKGFVKEAKLVFRSKQKPLVDDYHSEMNAMTFTEWFTNFLNTLEEPSVIVMDNAPYHSVELDKAPTTSSTKHDMIKWLSEKDIPFNTYQTRAELLETIKYYKQNKEKVYEIDQIAINKGHEVIRLPPYHCHYNPIELIWAQVKNYVAKKNKTFRINDVEELVHEAIDSVTQTDWQKCVEHAEKLQEEDFSKIVWREDLVQSVIINLDDTTDSSDFSDSDND